MHTTRHSFHPRVGGLAVQVERSRLIICISSPRLLTYQLRECRMCLEITNHRPLHIMLKIAMRRLRCPQTKIISHSLPTQISTFPEQITLATYLREKPTLIPLNA